MRSIHDYDVYIFDCDGVILDSNQLKIDAMQRALCALSFEESKVENCITYFSENFGKSRFHHVDVFIDRYLNIEDEVKGLIRLQVLRLFSEQCYDLYLNAKITPGFIDFILSIKGRKYVASGSEQEELRQVFKARGLDEYFIGIYGSPECKNKLIFNILEREPSRNAVMFGDAISDLDAATDNNIDFIGFTSYSNVKDIITKSAISNGHKVIESWGDA